MKQKISTQLAAGFAFIVLITVAVISITANGLISRQFEQYVAQQPQQNPMLALEMQKNALKAKELEIKEKLEQQRIDLENRQLDAETAIKVQKLDMEANGELGK